MSAAHFAAAAADTRWAGMAVIDYDGLWSSVQAVTAAETQGINLAYGANLATRTPSWDPQQLTGGRSRWLLDSQPRVQVLARPGQWPAFATLVTAGHHHEDSGPALPLHDKAVVQSAAGDVTLLLGLDSDVGRALVRGRSDLAYRALSDWQQAVDGQVAVGLQVDAVASPASVTVAVHLLELCRELGVQCIWQPVARYAAVEDHTIAHTLDAIRWAQPLKSVSELAASHVIAHEVSVARLGDVAHRVDGDRGSRLLTDSAMFWQSHTLNGAIDLGLGTAHPPEDMLVTTNGRAAHVELQERCFSALGQAFSTASAAYRIRAERLEAELSTIARLKYAAFFLTTATLARLARDLGVRVFARGSAVGSLVCHLLELTPIDPVEHGLLMARFCTTLRRDLPDIDLDVESARRHDVYRATFDHFSTSRCAAVGMIDSYRSRSALRDVGQAVGVSPARLDKLAKATPWHGSKDIFHTLSTLPELAYADLVQEKDRPWLDTVQAISRLPRHASMHPCGLVISNTTLLDRVATQPTSMGWPMCQLDKDDVETLGLLKADILGVRMQSAIAHTVKNVADQTGVQLELAEIAVDDERTFEVLRSTRTVGLFQVESPGQRALSGKLCAQDLTDITAQISLFRPGPVKADMISPFVAARHMLEPTPQWPERLQHIVSRTGGVVIWHEQVILLLSETMGISEAEADQLRRRLGSVSQRERIYRRWLPAAQGRGFSDDECAAIWEVLASFGSFGFCKAHAMAFGRTTFETAWLKAHYPAPFFAGLMEHDPGLYPAATILAEARRLGVQVLSPCVQHPASSWQAQLTESGSPADDGQQGELDCLAGELTYVNVPGTVIVGSRVPMTASSPRVSGWSLQVPLTVIPGVTVEEVERLVAASPFTDISDVWLRARPSRDVFWALAEGGALDRVPGPDGRAERLAQVYAVSRQGPVQESTGQQNLLAELAPEIDCVGEVVDSCDTAAAPGEMIQGASVEGDKETSPVEGLSPAIDQEAGQWLPYRPSADDVNPLAVVDHDKLWSEHVLVQHLPQLRELGVVLADELHACADKERVLVAGVRCVVHTPPTRSGIRVVFVSLDDPTGLVDLAFFPDSQGPHSAAAMTSEWVLAEGTITHTAPRSISITAHRAWNLREKIRELYERPAQVKQPAI